MVVFWIAAVAINDWAIPRGNTSAKQFDTIIVLGYPANLDGMPSPDQRERVEEGVREYKAGTAPRIIMTGAATHNVFVEAHVMAALAEQEGVPAEAILEEPQAQNTIQNVFYSSEIMREHGWKSAEIVSSQAHIARAAMIVPAIGKAHPDLAIQWKVKAAKWPEEYPFWKWMSLDGFEAARCLLIRVAGFPKSAFLPKG